MQQYPFIFSDEKRFRVRRHLAFWIAWWLFQSVLYAYTAGMNLLPDYNRLPVSMVNALFFLVPHVFLAYTLMYLVIPKFIFRARYFSAALAVLVLFFLTGCISSVIGVYVLNPVRECIFGGGDMSYSLPRDLAFFSGILGGLRGAITIGGLAAAIKLMKYWYIKEQRNLQLQKENIAAQLRLLQAQVHPHFLFNTLNNIYSHTQSVSPTAASLVMGLSDILRYILQEGSRSRTSLSRELKMLEEYMTLEQIRYDDRLEISKEITAWPGNLAIAPLILLPFVENSFKHGTSQLLEQPWIRLAITVDGYKMKMTLINAKLPVAEKDEQKNSGTGIANVKKRLDLLYQGKYELNITAEEDVFIVNLWIELEPAIEKTVGKGALQNEPAHA
ncbi:MAG: histidine kinase [Chitinophagaceae bacterium]